MRDLDEVFRGLARSSFRSRFRLGAQERACVHERGFDVVIQHARAFIEQRLSPAAPANDGKQTPFRGHPVFVAQHATGTCCRGCLQKWHGIEKGTDLTPEEQAHVIAALERWLRAQS